MSNKIIENSKQIELLENFEEKTISNVGMTQDFWVSRTGVISVFEGERNLCLSLEHVQEIVPVVLFLGWPGSRQMYRRMEIF